jgi:glycosyltransferase involved in cell wall biosynthesis
MSITPDNTMFIVLSFEGHDVYSTVGGLGARVTHLTNTLAGMGFQVHHIFIGDPKLEGIEGRKEGKLVLHRWCQWISQYHPFGVYDGEEGKLCDFTQSAPPFVVHELAIPAICQGKLVVVMGEEWQTAEAVCRISELLSGAGLQGMAVIFWNANNTYSFKRIDWGRLATAATITTVSRYMKQIMLKMGVNPLVIPNGIPKAVISEVNEGDVSTLRELVHADLILTKVARWHPDKGWKTVIQVMDSLRKSGRRPVLLARGSTDPYGQRIALQAWALGLKMKSLHLRGDPEEHYRRAALEREFSPYFKAISRVGSGDILNLRFPIPLSFLQVLYQASDVVLANSIHEPFGLVGLEAMAAGAVVFCGSSGEDYATHMYNAIVLDTSSAEEIEFYISYLHAHPEIRKTIGTAARRTAEQYTWEEVVETLLCKLEYQARLQGVSLPSEPEGSATEQDIILNSHFTPPPIEAARYSLLNVGSK